MLEPVLRVHSTILLFPFLFFLSANSLSLSLSLSVHSLSWNPFFSLSSASTFSHQSSTEWRKREEFKFELNGDFFFCKMGPQCLFVVASCAAHWRCHGHTTDLRAQVYRHIYSLLPSLPLSLSLSIYVSVCEVEFLCFMRFAFVDFNYIVRFLKQHTSGKFFKLHVIDSLALQFEVQFKTHFPFHENVEKRISHWNVSLSEKQVIVTAKADRRSCRWYFNGVLCVCFFMYKEKLGPLHWPIPSSYSYSSGMLFSHYLLA